MNLLRSIILAVILLFPISNSIGAVVTLVDRQIFDDGGQTLQNGILFNPDGTKMFVTFQNTPRSGINYGWINEYTLSTPFDISTHTYAGDNERCDFAVGAGSYSVNPTDIGDLVISSDGLKVFTMRRRIGGNTDTLYRFDLTTPYDVSTCSFVSEVAIDTDALQNGSNVGDRASSVRHYVQGIEINPDGTKLFLSFNDDSVNSGSFTDSIKEYTLSTPYDLSTISFTKKAVSLETAANNNPDAIAFGLNGKRIFATDHFTQTVTQFTLSTAYDISTATKDGSINIQDLDPSSQDQTRALAFSKDGLKMFVSDDNNTEEIFEFDLVCPFNIIAGKCPSITENKERTGIAEAQIETAKRAINMSTNSALNRLKWIRRNKDKENLTNQNAKLNFSGTMLSTLSPLPISSFKKISNHKTNKEDNKNYFHWSEGDISLGRIGETSTASRKENLTNSITYGVDRFKDDNGVEGFAIRYGLDDIDVGNVGSNLDSRTYNITYYNTSPMKNDTKYIDKIFGIGRIESDILTKLDGTNVTADRTGHQIYGTLKIKDEYKRNNLTFIPSGQIDLGHTKLDGYQEVGSGAIKVQDQHITTQNLRAAFAVVDDLSTDKYTFKRHGKLEYLADTDRSSSFKYNYVSDSSSTLIDNLETGALHNLNFEVGIDIVFPERFSLFAIYERNQTLDNGYSGHTDNLYLAIGYLPNKDTEYAFSLNGSENLVSNFEIKKKINDYNISFNLAENLMNLGEASNASININKVF